MKIRFVIRTEIYILRNLHHHSNRLYFRYSFVGAHRELWNGKYWRIFGLKLRVCKIHSFEFMEDLDLKFLRKCNFSLIFNYLILVHLNLIYSQTKNMKNMSMERTILYICIGDRLCVYLMVIYFLTFVRE